MAFADITTLTVDVAFTTDPLDTPAWTTIPASKVRAVQIERGRSSEFETMNAGKCTITLDNSTRDFDPLHTGSPYYPNVKPMKRARVRMTYNSVVYDLFHGFADGWPQSYSPPNDAEVQLRCTDGFKILARSELPTVYEMEVTADDPAQWWRLGESGGTVAANAVTDVDGTYVESGESSTVELGIEGAAPGDTAARLGGGQFDPGGHPAGYITMPKEAAVTGTTAFTIEQWWKQVNPDDGSILFRQTDGTSPAIELECNGISLFFSSGTGSSQVNFFPLGIAVDDRLHHIVAVREASGQARVYVDGVLKGSGSVVAPVSIPARPLWVNHTPEADPSPANMEVDELAIYHSALSAARITAHYEAATAPWGTHDSDQRVTAVLDAVGWPAADRSIGDGRSALQDAALDTTALEHLGAVDLTENGRLFVGKDGKVKFVGRHDLLKPPYTTSQGTFGDGTGELPHTPGLRYGYDDDQVKTTVRVSSQGQTTQTAEDATAKATYGPLTLERSGTLYDTAGEMRDAADYLLAQYKAPLLRAEVLEISPMADPANLLPQVLGRELADRITLVTRPQSVGTAISQPQLIEGIELNITPGDMTCRWYVSPADTREYWVLGTSALGTGTRLGF